MSLSLILLVLGIFLFYMGRIEIGTLRAAGRHVKAAGIILTLPAAVTLVLINFIIPLIFGGNFDAAMAAVGFVAFLELFGIFAAAALAYVLLADPPGVPRLPGVLGDLQEEARKHRPAAVQPQQRRKIVTIPTPGMRPVSHNRDSYPRIMNLQQAARYLNTSEEDVLRLIEEGKLAASRDNFAYKIARSQLDELL